MPKISASLMSADYTNLVEQVKLLEKAGIDMLHFDIMDGIFVPNFAMTQLEVKALRPLTKLPFDVHLMIKEPIKHIKLFSEAGADIITVHAEACADLAETIQEIKKYGKKAGVAINPDTPIQKMQSVLDKIDMVIIMTVNPGFGGQKCIESVLPKIKELREIIKKNNLNIDIEVDGDVKEDTVSKMAENGANLFASGTGIFKGNTIEENVKKIRENAESNLYK
ncbi:ribulose-phosphate 3-epimerase [Candidatus Woesearchaeota archaeon]|nr:ribulose-phosphate 3-epimerase [Candidatus Woesearchaeota archaeon]|tara:strand:- start:7698 stop:8366 length:669 start_codon:yes stop_codon:yes gene_type:complete